jgi:hypothetical protein
MVDRIEQAGSEAKSRIGKARFMSNLLGNKGLECVAPSDKSAVLPDIIGVDVGNLSGQPRFALTQRRLHPREHDGVAGVAIHYGAGIATMIDPPESHDERDAHQDMRQEA